MASPSISQPLAERGAAWVTCSKSLTASLYLPACRSAVPCWYSTSGSYWGPVGAVLIPPPLGMPPPPMPPEPIAKVEGWQADKGESRGDGKRCARSFHGSLILTRVPRADTVAKITRRVITRPPAASRHIRD